MSKAHDTDREAQGSAHVRRASVPALSYEEMSELGRDLFDMSREYEDSGEELLTEEEIEVELARRRGGRAQDSDG